jgi:hypothetical protein
MNAICNTLLSAILVSAGAWLMGAPAHAATEIVSSVAPPPERVEHAPAPRDGYVWNQGHWEWSGHSYAWVAGTWIVARPKAHWVADHWNQVGDQWHYLAGHWER